MPHAMCIALIEANLKRRRDRSNSFFMVLHSCWHWIRFKTKTITQKRNTRSHWNVIWENSNLRLIIRTVKKQFGQMTSNWKSVFLPKFEYCDLQKNWLYLFWIIKTRKGRWAENVNKKISKCIWQEISEFVIIQKR